jgi:flagellar protein FlgJ
MIDSQVLGQVNLSESYTDINSLQAIRSLGMADKNAALGEISKEFESMLVRMMLKSMRQANEVFSEGNPLSSKEGAFYQNMLDDQLAVSLSKGKGIGLGDIMKRQLLRTFGDKTENTSGDKTLKENNATADSLSHNSLQQLLQRRRTTAVAAMPIINGLSGAKENSDMNKQNDSAISFDGSVEGFVDQLYSMAKQAAEVLGIDTDVLLSQAALETGWGKKMSVGSDGQSSFNLFNIKADKSWKGDTVTVPTLEFYNGLPVREFSAFRAYESPQQSFNDYVNFIANSPRYQQALGTSDSKDYMKQISEAGYATDPRYAEKVMNIINSESMQRATEKNKLATIDG